MKSNASQTLSAITAARMGWMTGQTVSVTLPELQGLDQSEANLRLLAMDAQLRCLTVAPVAGVEVRLASDFVAPDGAYPPDDARDRLRRLWAETQVLEKVLLLRLMDRRGYVAHPFEFVPHLLWDGLPDVYLPILAWHRGFAGGDDDTQPDPYHTYSRETVQQTFATLKAQGLTDAHHWLETELGAANAQHRLRLLQDIASQFDRADLGFLTDKLTSERSGKVKTLLVRVLRRLGAKTEIPEDLSALDYLERSTKGLLRRRPQISAPAKMNATRVGLLKALIHDMGFADLATQVSASEIELINMWDWKDSHPKISDAIRQSIIETASDTACEHLLSHQPDSLLHLAHLGPETVQGMTATLRDKAIDATIKAGSLGSELVWTLPRLFCNWRIEDLSAAQSSALWEKVRAHPDIAKAPDKDTQKLDRFKSEILTLAMCLHPKDAQSALEHFIKTFDLHVTDPLLAPFHLNLALPQVAASTQTERP